MSDNTDMFTNELIDAQQAALDASKEEFKRLHAVIKKLMEVHRFANVVAGEVEDCGETYLCIESMPYIDLRSALDKCN